MPSRAKTSRPADNPTAGLPHPPGPEDLKACLGKAAPLFTRAQKELEAAFALELAKKSDLPEAVQELLRSARRYAEGNAVSIPVRTAADLAVVKVLVAAKLGH